MRRLAVAVSDRTQAKGVVLALRRQELERWIKQAIAILDDLDGDADFEPETDLEDEEREEEGYPV